MIIQLYLLITIPGKKLYEQSFISGAYFSAEQAGRMSRLRQVREVFTATKKLLEPCMLNKSADVGKYVKTKLKCIISVYVCS